MLALLKDALSVARSLIITEQQPLSGYGLFRVFTSSQIQSKFRRAQPTEAELLEMRRDLRWYYRRREDPEFLSQKNERERIRHEKTRQRRQDDPAFKQQELIRWRNQSRNNSDDYRFRRAFNLWLRTLPQSKREAYAWKTHLPVVFPTRRRLTCSDCSDYPATSRLWWKRLDGHTAPEISDAQEYTCHSCYMDQDKSKIFPVELENHVSRLGKRKPEPYKPYKVD